jgi:amidophosphoribosyltransferase
MVRNPCFYGIDMPTKEELFANKHENEKAMGEMIGADSLAFLSTEGLLEAVDVDVSDTSGRCIACFSGAYPTKLYLK